MRIVLKLYRSIKLVVWFLSLYLSANISLAGGWAAFEAYTPYDNKLMYAGTGGRIQFFFNEYSGAKLKVQPTFEKFYFYKNHIIAKSSGEFFVIDERRQDVMHFSEDESFGKYIHENQLVPMVWTRWYDRNYDESNFKWLGFFAVIMFPLTLLLLGLYFYCLYNLLIKKGVRFKIVKKLYVGALSCFVLLVVLLQTFPQSF